MEAGGGGEWGDKGGGVTFLRISRFKRYRQTIDVPSNRRVPALPLAAAPRAALVIRNSLIQLLPSEYRVQTITAPQHSSGEGR